MRLRRAESDDPGGGKDIPPLILTLGMDEQSLAYFDGLRRTHFPKKRNFIPAHITLFHKLPGERALETAAQVMDIALEQEGFRLGVQRVVFTGRGVAFRLEKGPLPRLRAQVARPFAHLLSPQDSQGFNPHITIQNKVNPAEAHSLFARMEADFSPFSLSATGFHLWRYMGGPWDSLGFFPFRK